MDALEELSERASRFSINLNAVVDRDATIPPLRGGNANVYAGTLQSTGMRVAVKTVRSAPLSDINTLKNIFREVHLWSKLRHKNVVSLLGIATKFEQTVSIISEWMERGNAIDYVQNHAIDPRPLLVDIASGLHYLHTHEEGPIFHGDLKGLNVLISDDGRALLTDFGFSYLVTSSFSMTVDAPLGGTLRWMAPEILDNHEISAEGDVWAFGMTTLELFTRKPPFHDLPTPGSVMARILRGPPDRPSDASTCFRMTDYWWDICTLCWTRDPLSRPTMTEIVAIVQEYMNALVPAFPETSQGHLPPRVVGGSASSSLTIGPGARPRVPNEFWRSRLSGRIPSSIGQDGRSLALLSSKQSFDARKRWLRAGHAVLFVTRIGVLLRLPFLMNQKNDDRHEYKQGIELRSMQLRRRAR